MKRLSKKIALSTPKFQCMHCGRQLIEMIPHKCNTGFRKRHMRWLDLETGEIIQRVKNENSKI